LLWMQVLLLVWSAIVVWASSESPCLTYSLAPLTTQLLSNSLPQFQFPLSAKQLPSTVKLVWDAQIPGTEAQAALFFATPTENKLFVRIRNCASPDFGVGGDVCIGRTDRIVEIYCPSLFGEELHVFTFDGSALTIVSQFILPFPPVYNQFWYLWGASGGTGFTDNSGIPNLSSNYTNDFVFVRPAYGNSGLIAVTGAIRSATESCTSSIDCMVGAWSDYGSCDAKCDGGQQHRTRAPIVVGQFGGQPCPNFGESKLCNTEACPVGLSGNARAGVVIACIVSVILAFLIFFSLSKHKRLFNNKKHQTSKKVPEHTSKHPSHQSVHPSQPQRATIKSSSADEEDTTPTPVKSVQLWV